MRPGYQLPVYKELNEKEFHETIETLGCVPLENLHKQRPRR